MQGSGKMPGGGKLPKGGAEARSEGPTFTITVGEKETTYELPTEPKDLEDPNKHGQFLHLAGDLCSLLAEHDPEQPMEEEERAGYIALRDHLTTLAQACGGNRKYEGHLVNIREMIKNLNLITGTESALETPIAETGTESTAEAIVAKTITEARVATRGEIKETLGGKLKEILHIIFIESDEESSKQPVGKIRRIIKEIGNIIDIIRNPS